MKFIIIIMRDAYKPILLVIQEIEQQLKKLMTMMIMMMITMKGCQ